MESLTKSLFAALDFHGLSIQESLIEYLLSVVVVPPGEDLASVSDGQAVESSHRHVNDLLTAETFHQGGLPHVLVSPVAQPVVISLAPGPDHPSLGQSQAKLGPALDLNDSHPVEFLHIGRDSAALTASPAKLAKVGILG